MHGEPEPKRRCALRHALGGLTLLSCVWLNLTLTEWAGWTDFRGWWRDQRVRLLGAPTKRQYVEEGMTRAEVCRRIGCGSCFEYLRGDVVPLGGIEYYPECGFQIRYHPQAWVDPDKWRVAGVEDYHPHVGRMTGRE